MRVVIYESSSRGGCYEYSLYLLKHYSKHPTVDKCELIIPKGSSSNGVHLLLNDRRHFKFALFSRLYFLIRSLVNPIRLFIYLIKKEKSLVILNDFEQITSWLWGPLFTFLRKKHLIAIFLHDPDRDHYTSWKWFSRFSMRMVMCVPHLALFHEFLPDKSYYKKNACHYLSVPHGLYTSSTPDMKFFEYYVDKSKFTFVIPGNIRREKNYHLCIDALKYVENARLIIAGNPASSQVNIQELQQRAEEQGVNERVIFILRYLSNEEMSALIQLADAALIYYSASFTSQSGIFNLVAPHRLKILASDLQNPMTLLTKRFNLGICVAPDNLNSLINGMADILKSDKLQADWNGYYSYASWQHQVNLVLEYAKSKNIIR